MDKTVILAYSGGLDTSCILAWLIEQGYKVVAYTGNVGQEEDFDELKKKALNIGATEVSPPPPPRTSARSGCGQRTEGQPLARLGRDRDVMDDAAVGRQARLANSTTSSMTYRAPSLPGSRSTGIENACNLFRSSFSDSMMDPASRPRGDTGGDRRPAIRVRGGLHIPRPGREPRVRKQVPAGDVPGQAMPRQGDDEGGCGQGSPVRLARGHGKGERPGPIRTRLLRDRPVRAGELFTGGRNRGLGSVSRRIKMTPLSEFVRLGKKSEASSGISVLSQVIAPWRMREFVERFRGRKDLMAYAEKRGIPVPVTPSAPWSMDANLMHISYESGILEDPSCSPPSDLYQMTVAPEKAIDQPQFVRVHFVKGSESFSTFAPLVV
ncbi:unnamed protein product [Darwinula stevensoni]|uniref:argininosuccinate synthase n=1 Tax=Darwinula stevensoni TaxID=69355 RepID=A0A7R9AII0_9CRUS|nr:unnamed protein product [Darwinula stevensoni]CAG0905971.1 unnamed protein product [Darwinula stevensoni]